jgi:hypothetical protein
VYGGGGSASIGGGKSEARGGSSGSRSLPFSLISIVNAGDERRKDE